MKRTTALRIAWLLAVLACLAPACATKTSVGTDSSTHWLEQCKTDDDCGELSCECGVCTKECTTPSDCSRLSASAECQAVPGCGSNGQVCLKQPLDGGDDIALGVCPAGTVEGSSCVGSGLTHCSTVCAGGTATSDLLACISGSWGKSPFGSSPCDSGTVDVSTSCEKNSDCYAANSTCCGTCGEPGLSDRRAIAVSSRSAYEGVVCSGSGACPPCVPPSGTIVAVCRNAQCVLEDVKAQTSCTKDEDCQVVPRDCCACGIVAASALTVTSSGFSACPPAVTCPECFGISLPPEYKATCNVARGYCELAPPP